MFASRDGRRRLLLSAVLWEDAADDEEGEAMMGVGNDRRRKIFVVILMTLSLSSLSSGSASATTTPAPPIPPLGPAGPASPIVIIDPNAAWLAAGLLLFGLLVIAVLYYYLHAWRRDTTNLIREAIKRTGQPPALQIIASSEGDRWQDGLQDSTAADAVVVKGPDRVTVGQPSADFTATRGREPVDAQWSVEGAGTMDPVAGSAAKLTAYRPGEVTVVAEVDGKTLKLLTLAVESAESRGGVPVVASGYNGITIAILAVSVAAALTAVGLLPSAALATLLGTVVSYFFATRSRDGGDVGK
jgi:hypothetical protein